MKILRAILPMVLLALVGCQSGDEPGRESIDMPINLSIPVEAGASRAIGDPGQADQWDMPSNAYIFIVTYETEADAKDKSKPAIIPIIRSLDKNKWEYDAAKSEEYGGKVYTYRGNISVSKPVNAEAGYVYAALSSAPITLSTEKPSSEDDLKKISFTIPQGLNDEQRDALLKNLYSTPYKLRESQTPEQYGVIQGFATNVPTADVVCYHVAAKLDLTWTVADAVQQDVKLSEIIVKGVIPMSGALLFDPTNSDNNLPTTDAKDAVFLQTENKEQGAGQQWYGRKSMYIIQDNKRTKFQILLKKNWSEKSREVEVTIPDAELKKYNPHFTPWMRMNIHVNSNFGENATN